LTRRAALDLTNAAPVALSVAGLGDYAGVVAEYQAKALLGPLGISFPLAGLQRMPRQRSRRPKRSAIPWR
jgi:diacylglycerol kinase family enzyme